MSEHTQNQPTMDNKNTHSVTLDDVAIARWHSAHIGAKIILSQPEQE